MLLRKLLIPTLLNQIKRPKLIRNYSTNLVSQISSNSDIKLPETTNKSLLDPLEETDDIEHIAPFLKPTFNFAAYVNRSETLQELLKLGVNLYKLEQNRNEEVVPFILSLDFEKDVKKYVEFMYNLGLTVVEIGEFITKNPFIFKEDLENLQVRLNYLKSKKFNDTMILDIVRRNPIWLNFSTQDIDARLGHFQKTFGLTGNQVRQMVVTNPRIVTYNLEKIKLNLFAIKEEMGFTEEEIRSMLLKKPKMFMNSQVRLLKTFEYVHKEMNIPLEQILQTPEILTYRVSKIKNRHLFLKKLGRDQFNPKKENYVALTTLATGNDADFCANVAKSSVNIYNEFLKTL